MTSIPLKCALLCAVLLFANSSIAAEQLYTQQPSVTPELATPGKWQVGVTTIEAINENQLGAKDFTTREDRKLTIEVWYPANIQAKDSLASYKNNTRSGKKFELQATAFRDSKPVKENDSFPLVILSHGYTGYRTIMFYLGEHLASHGYVVAAIDHTDSTNAEIDFDKNSGKGFPSTLLNRARDQQFVLDYFATSKSDLAKTIDTNHTSIIGYSMGAFGALNTVGGCYSFSEQTLQSLGFPPQQAQAVLPILNTCNAGRAEVDPRWRAMIAFAPWGGELNVHDTTSLKQIKIPTFFVSGSHDDVSGYENGVKKLFEQTISPANHLLVYENARHNIAAHPAPKAAYGSDLDIGHYFEPSWNSETINRINRHMSLAFLNCFIKAKKDACSVLPKRQDISQTKQENGELSSVWPGFKERWGTGIKFYRK